MILKKMMQVFWVGVILTVSCAVQAQPVSRVRLETTMGNIVVALDTQKAPKTVENFLKYTREGFYDGTIFHRVIKDFMIQGGGLTVEMQKKPTAPPVINEADNGLRNSRGAVAMARTADPDSATSQFFINVKDNDFLNFKGRANRDWGYCVFGQVIEGMDVVEKIENVSTGFKGMRRDVPKTPVVIQHAVIVSE